ncbi:MAG: histidine kinase N-terminal 7TM domain-containing protein, partial [Lachnospiraceae bacterium]
MRWNIAPECTALVIISIVFYYARTKNVLPTLRKFLFKLCFIGSIVTVLFNIITAFVLMEHMFFPLWFQWVIFMIYYLTTPVYGILFLLYSFSVLTEDKRKLIQMSVFGLIPTILYLLVVLSNPFSHLIFNVIPTVGYVRGPWIALAFINTYIYCLIVFIFSNMRCFKVTRLERL